MQKRRGSSAGLPSRSSASAEPSPAKRVAPEPTSLYDDALSAMTLLLLVRVLPVVGLPSLMRVAHRLLSLVPRLALDTVMGPGPAEALANSTLAAAQAGPPWVFRLDLIGDCDETFNYWEPAHYELFGRGLQTWEYDPRFALRSYLYPLLHAALAAVPGGAAWGVGKERVFLHVRLLLALASAAAEAALYVAVAQRFGRRVGNYTLAGLVASAGMLLAAPAFLPSSWTMVGLTFAWAAWLQGGMAAAAAAAAAVGLLLGWPFAAVALAPMALHLLLRERSSLPRFIASGAAVSAAVLAAGAGVDRVFFGRWLLAPLNLIRYNVLGEGGGGQGSNLYGVEPAHYYAQSLALNFNVLAVLAALSPAALYFLSRAAVESAAADTKAAETPSEGDAGEDEEEDDAVVLFRGPSAGFALAALAQLWLWVALMSARPHKEERFMFPVYPLVPLAAALTLVALERALVVPAMAAVAAYAHSAPAGAAPRRRPVAGTSLVRTAFAGAALGAAGLVSMSRVSALIHGFSAPMHVWEVLGQHIQAHPADAATRDGLEAGSATLTATARPWLGLYNATNYRPSVPAGVKPPPRLSSPGVVVCVGKEWYRFPSHFFLPEATRKDAARHPHPDRSFREGGPAEVGFLKSNFSGLLPAPYLRKVGGSTEPRPDDFNDENREGPRKNYKFVDHCDYVIDLQLPASRTQQPRYESHFALLPAVPERASYADVLKMCKRGEDAPEPPPMPPCKCVGDEKTAARWESIYCVPFMDREASGALARAFYVPGYSESRTAWAPYHILRKDQCNC